MTKVSNPFEIIPYRPSDEPLVCLQINRYWLKALYAMVAKHQYPEFWLGSRDENRQARLDVKELLDIIIEAGGCDDMTDCNCVVTVVVLHRIDPITLQLQISIDGGQTWTPDPDAASNSIVEQAPPVTLGSVANKCDAATNGKQHIEDWIAHVSTSFETYGTWFEWAVGIIVVIADLALAVFTGGGSIAELLPWLGGAMALSKQIWATGQALWDEYWTSDERDKVLCALVCNIGDNGAFTDAQFEAALSRMQSDLTPGIAPLFLTTMLRNIGRAGLNNMCSYGNASNADCSSCDCTCAHNWQVIVGEEIEPLLDGYHTYQSVFDNDRNKLYIQTSDKDTCCKALDVVFAPGSQQPFSIQAWECGLDWTQNPTSIALESSCVSKVQMLTHPVDSPHGVITVSILWSDCDA